MLYINFILCEKQSIVEKQRRNSEWMEKYDDMYMTRNCWRKNSDPWMAGKVRRDQHMECVTWGKIDLPAMGLWQWCDADVSSENKTLVRYLIYLVYLVSKNSWMLTRRNTKTVMFTWWSYLRLDHILFSCNGIPQTWQNLGLGFLGRGPKIIKCIGLWIDTEDSQVVVTTLRSWSSLPRMMKQAK